ncbi:MAG: hypothetical protein GY845_35050 [Planctomycetes bacterium]|nr:hypothetical protein [Planctomycetota bacterium]
MFKKLICLVTFVFMLSSAASVSASTFILDEFDDGDIATNTSDVGDGFEINEGGIGGVTEADDLATILGGDSGANRNQMGSKDSFSANGSPVFGIFTVTDMYRTNSADNGTARFYVGFSDTLPNAQGPLQTSSVNGLWIVIHGRYTYTGVDTWNTGDGGLVHVSNGVRTALAQWTWDSSVFTFDTASNLRSDRVALDMIASDLTFVLSSDAAGYSLTISSKDGTAVLPEPMIGTWAEAGVTNDLSQVYASAWTQGASPDNPMGLVLDRIVVNDEGWAESPKFPHARSPKPKDGALLEDTWANLSWRAGDLAVSHDIYIGDDFDAVNEGAEGMFIGNQTGTFIVVGFPGMPLPDGLVPGTTYYWRIDEVNEAEPNSPWKGDIWSFSVPPKTAYFPDPADGAESVSVNVQLSWTGGFGSKLHTVYFGETFDEVDNATGGSSQGSSEFTPGTLKMAKTYYWRVDEFDAMETHKGNVWSFITEGGVGSPNPAKGAMDVTQTPVITWAPGLGTTHDIYFGTDPDALELKGSGNLGSERFEPGELEWNTTYYWRVDEANNANADSPWIGPLWNFTTANFLVIEDFESYNDLDPDDPNSNRIFNSWIDGFENPTINGSVVGNVNAPFAEQTIVHGGSQSMPMTYDNAVGKSEATLTLTSNRDWTVNGVDTLTIWFRGNAANAAETMYVMLNGSASIDNDNPDAALATGWTEWNTTLQAFTDQGVNLTNVTSITLGLRSGTGGTGIMYFDDIRLYPPTQ